MSFFEYICILIQSVTNIISSCYRFHQISTIFFYIRNLNLCLFNRLWLWLWLCFFCCRLWFFLCCRMSFLFLLLRSFFFSCWHFLLLLWCSRCCFCFLCLYGFCCWRCLLCYHTCFPPKIYTQVYWHYLITMLFLTRNNNKNFCP